ncbi:hypothetical protein MYCTH_2301911 [Thermothelomyces thermophilus ATCC 42464]|uniref:Ubiquitination network signaling protein n=1 Tax=Thermothelomyces thermophilus (strain ATCC 42464 / BCRC 31852 / DSM 1799) TaxID=573729 RepID=G2QAL1_THET4|nr:uncharacterized protein MYCTH_2301911 [Thermothelomyces thermophilus ATCC 42464]AEO56707.1 hypothetical protein MYCTH_2301911 [Thermothelomyces thermophilus ATCC 42464]
MPRASNSAKRHPAASNQRDTRHENGLVGPGKRVIKRKSHGQLDDGSKPAVDSASVPPVPPLPTAANGSAAHPDDMAPEHRATELLRRGSLGTYSESSSADSLPVPPTHDGPQDSHRRIDVNDAKNTNVHRDPGPLDLAITVLRSCPLADTVAILIILMQASPAVLATIYMLFTVLTFVPPVTTSSGLSITEIFDGSQGIPSLWTLIWMDFIMLLIWLFLWAPIQQFILDLAQVVISYTLGGGASSRQGTTPGIVLCVGIVGMSHWVQKWNGLSRLTTLFGSNRFLSTDAEPNIRMLDKKGPYGWVRSVLAIHILTQGIVRCIREWYLRRERRDLQSQGLLDPESGKSVSFPPEGFSEAALMAADSDAHLQTSVAHLTNKRRRKQSAQVRIKQPLWAALASTKIVMVKEYELSHAASESAGSNATDIHNLGNAPFNTQPEHIWICYVGCDEVCFNTSHFPDVGQDEAPQDDSKLGIDMSKPFYVRVNNAIWQPTRIIPIENPEEENYEGTRWTGDIYGLTPLSNYECEFVSTRTGEVIFSTSVRTVPAKNKDPEAAPKAASNPRSHARHDSPATTLRASIAAAELKLADEKARLKAVRKDNNRKLNATRKEIEKLTAAAQSAGGDDEKLRQKIAQNRIQEKRAEESTSELEAQLKELETVPEALVQEHRAKHDEWTSEKAKFDQARASFKSFKASIDKQVKSLDEEKASLQAKRNKIAARIAKVDDEHARITDANARGLNEAERRRQERANLAAELGRAEQNLRERLQTLRLNNATKQAQVHAMAAHMQEYLASFQNETAYDMAPQPNHFPAAAAGPWAAAPAGPATQFSAAQPAWPPVTMSMSAQVTPLMAPSQLSTFSTPMQTALSTPPQPHRTRGRSSSMLSDVSGFTQSTDEDEHDSGSGSGNGSLNNASAVASVPVGRYRNGGGNPGGGGSGNASPAGTATLRGPPPGFHLKGGSASGSDSSGSASGFGSGSGSGSGRSSVRSGSGSGASLREAASPV